MDTDFVLEGKKFISSKSAALQSGFTYDYISRLCRHGKLEGRKVGNGWHVNEQSLRTFLSDIAEEKKKRSRELSEKRKSEYAASCATVPVFPKETIDPPPFAEKKETASDVFNGARIPVTALYARGHRELVTRTFLLFARGALGLLVVLGLSFGAYAFTDYTDGDAAGALERAPVQVRDAFLEARGFAVEYIDTVTPAQVSDSGLSFFARITDALSQGLSSLFGFARTLFPGPVAITEENQIAEEGAGDTPPAFPAGGDDASDAPGAGVLGINAAVDVEDALSVGGSLAVNGNVGVAGAGTFSGAVTVSGSLEANAGITTNNADINAGAGQIFASNLINSLVAGRNVFITGTPQNPVISARGAVSRSGGGGGVSTLLDGIGGSLTIVDGADIDAGVSGTSFTIANISTLETVRARGGCAECVLDADVDNALTILSGAIDATPIGASTSSTAIFTVATTSELFVTATSTTGLTLEAIGSCSGSNALQTDGDGGVVCGPIASLGVSIAGGWGTDSAGNVTLATTTDRVGIGATTTPYAKLSVLSGSAATTTLALVPATGQTANILDIYDATGALASVFTADHFFGIGTTSPFARLSIAGGNVHIDDDLTASNITTTGTLAVEGSATSTFTGGISTGGLRATSGGLQLDTYNCSALGNSGKLTTDANGNVICAPDNGGDGTGASGNAGAVQFNNGSGNFTANTHFIFDDANTRLGIGTTSPYARLSVAGEVVASHFTGTTTATSTLAGGLSTGGLASSEGITLSGGALLITSGATSTANNGFDISSGCYAIGGSCISAGSLGGITEIGPAGQTQTGSTITLATSTDTANGITSALTITGSGGTLTFTPSLSGTLAVSGGGTGLSSLGASSTVLVSTGSANAYQVLDFGYIGGTLGAAQGGTGTTSPSGFLYGPNDGTLVSTTTIAENFIDGAIARDSELHDAVTLAGSLDYLTLSGQEITRNAIDLATDVTGVLPDANVADDITLTNLTQITSRAIADTTGTLAVSRGGTGQTSFTNDTVLAIDGSGAFTSSSTVSSAFIEDAYVRNTGDSISGNLTFSGSSANVALGSNWLSGDGGDEGVYVAGSGNVGIGTASLSARLDIAGISTTMPGIDITSNPADGEAHTQLVAGLAASDRALRIISDQESGAINNFLTHNLAYDSATYTQGSWGGSSMVRFDNSGHMMFYTDSQDTGGSQTAITPSERLRITDTGNVGIGTTGPDAPLEVKVSAATTEAKIFELVANDNRSLSILQPDNADDNDPFTFATNNAYQFRVDSVDALNISANGNVGIGTTSPDQKFVVQGVIRANVNNSGLQGVNTGGTAVNLIRLNSSDKIAVFNDNHIFTSIQYQAKDGSAGIPSLGFASDTDTGIYWPTTNEIAFTTGASEKVRIDSSGNVGIGTTSPASTLDVWGEMRVGTGSVPTLLVDTAAGAVALGATAPAAGNTLHVAGQCVTADTRLRRRRRRKKGEEPDAQKGEWADDEYIYDEPQIVDVKEGDEIASMDQKTGAIVWSRVNALMHMGVKPVFRLMTKSGRSIRTTDNHPYLTESGWTKVKDLRVGDRVAVPRERSRVTYAFIDASNIIYGAREAGFKVDFAKLMRYLTTRYGAARVFYYGGVDEGDKRQWKFYEKLQQLGFELRLVPMKTFRDGKKKADCDSRMSVEAMKLLPECDEAIFLTGDGDFYWLLDEYTAARKRVRLLSFAKRTARELTRLVGAQFADIASARVHIERVEGEQPEEKTKATDTCNVSAARVIQEAYTPPEGKSSADDAPGDIVWDEIAAIDALQEEQVYDIEIEGTRNFIGNDIVAHNTYLSGNVGVGLSSPNVRLHVDGGDVQFNDSSDNPGLYFDESTGRLGLGTTSPSTKLTVYGDALLEGDSRYLNFGGAVGAAGYGFRDNSGALQYRDSGGSWAAFDASGPFTSVPSSGNYDTGSATFDSVALSVASQETSPQDMLFNNDGTTLYVIGDNGQDINAYTLSTAYDISTASFSAIALSVSGQETVPRAMLFNNDGTTLYVMGSTGDDINAYPLPTPYDISSYTSGTSVALSVGSQDTTPTSMLFNDDGTKLYVLGYTGQDVNAYTLSTAYDISTATFDSIALSVSGQETEPFDMLFNNDGTTLYVLGFAGDDINEYSLGTAYDISTATFDSIALSVSGQETEPIAMLFNNDGGTFYVLGWTGDDINEYTIPVTGGRIYTTDTAQSVGVGITTPTGKLTVRTSGTTDILNLLEAGGEEVFTVLESGNVGLGTTSPSAKLHLAPVAFSTNQAGGLLLSNTSNSSWDSSVFLRSNAGGSSRLSLSGPGVTDSLVIVSSGNVGIGTTSPNYKLTISGNDGTDGGITESGILIRNDASGAEAGLAIQSADTGSNSWFAGLNASTSYQIGYGTGFSNAGTYLSITPTGDVGIGAGNTSPSGTLDILTGSTGNNLHTRFEEVSSNQQAIVFREASNDFFRILHDGSGFNPDNKLLIQTDGGTGDGVIDTEIIAFTQTGNVGIGTSSPTAILQAVGSSFTELFRIDRTDVDTTLSAYGGNDSVGSFIYLTANGGGSQFQFRDNGIYTFQGGNVGIGTSTPGSNLSVVSGLSVGSNYGVAAPSGGAIIQGNVGIGDTSPAALLTVGDGDHFQVNSSGAIAAATGITSSGAITFSGLSDGVVQAVSGALSATSSIASAFIEDAYVRNTGDSISGNLTFSGSSANIALGSNWLSGDGDDEGIFVDGSGNVGIGTTSPSALLSIVGPGSDVAVELLRLEDPNPSGSGPNWSKGYIFLPRDEDNSGTRGLVIGQQANRTDDGAPGNASFIRAGGAVSENIALEPGLNSSNEIGLVELSNPTPASSTENMRAPTFRFLGKYWNGTVSSNDQWLIEPLLGEGTNPTTTLQFSHNGTPGTASYNFLDGNVGIGTTSPAEALTVDGNILLPNPGVSFDRRIELEVNGGSEKNYIRFSKGLLGTESEWDVGHVFSDNSYTFGVSRADGANYLAITTDGNVGIGTTSPASVLDVWGEMRVGTGSVPTLLVDTAAGAVALGATAPAAGNTLHVAGQCVTADTRLRRRRRRGKNAPGDPGLSDKELEKKYGSQTSVTSVMWDEQYIYDEVEIVNIKEGDEIASLDEKTGRIVYSRVNALMDMGVKQTYRLTTSDGRSIRTTANHPYLVKHVGNRAPKHASPIDGAGWLPVSDIAAGDSIAVGKPRLAVFVDDANTFYGRRKAGMKLNWRAIRDELAATFDLTFIHYHMAMPSADDTEAYEKSLAFKETLPEGIAVREKQLKYIKTIAPDGTVSVTRKGDVDMEIAVDVWRSFEDVDAVLVFAGDSDYVALRNEVLRRGKKIAFASFKKTIAWEIIRGGPHILLDRLARKNRDKAQTPSAGLGVLLRSLWYSGAVDMSSPHNDAVDNAVWVDVATIRPVAEEQVWDVEIEGTRNFIGNDIVAHNTYLGGNVGIGTTSPGQKLTLSDSSDFSLEFEHTGANGNEWYISNIAGAGNTGGLRFYDGDAALERMRITNSGNVGIGTTSPSSKLTVYGDTLLEGSDRYLNFGTATGSTGYGFRDNSGTLQFKNDAGSWSDFGSGGAFTEIDTSAYFNNAGNIAIGTTSTTTARLIVQSTSTSDILNLFETGGSEVLTVTEAGYLGIGTSSPTEKLTITGGNIGIGGAGEVRFYDSDSSNYAALQASSALSSNITFTLPASLGLSGQVLTTDGTGELSWTNSGGGTTQYGLMESEWEDTGSDLPYDWGISQLAVIGGYVYLFGGYNGSAADRDILRAPVSDPTTWSDTGSDLPYDRAASQLAVIGGYVYLFGGYNGSAFDRDILRAPVSDPTTWSDTGSDLPYDWGHSQLAVIGDYVYLFGGHNGSAFDRDILRAPVSDPTIWSDTGSDLPYDWGNSQLAVIGDYVYLFGGHNGSAADRDILRAPVSDPTTWSDTGSDLPYDRRFSQLAVIGDYVYLFGGRNGSAFDRDILRAPVSDPTTWSDTGSDLPYDWGKSQLAVIGDYVYLFGGENINAFDRDILRAPIFTHGPNLASNKDWKAQGNAGLGSGGNLIQDNDRDTMVQVEEGTDDDTIRFDTAGQERAVITSAGLFGIGTSSPYAKFAITGIAGQENPLFEIASSTDDSYLRVSNLGDISVGTTTSSAKLTIQTTGTNDILNLFETSGSEVLTVTEAGYLGIGTTSPFAKLSVSGQIAGDYLTLTDGSATSTIAGGLSINNGAFLYDFGANKTTIERLDLGNIKFEEDAGKVSWIDLEVSSSASAGTPQAYSAQIDGNSVFTIYAQADGSGGITDVRTVVGTSSDTVLGSANIPYGSMVVANGALCVDDGEGDAATCASSARSAGGIYSAVAAATGLDLAERYPTKDDTLEAGEIVMADTENPVYVSRYEFATYEIETMGGTGTTTATSSTELLNLAGSAVPLGIVSTKPGFILGGFAPEYPEEREIDIALSGRVPIKVTSEHGAIAVGDRIMPSFTMPGMGMKATSSGHIVGIALESAFATSTGEGIETGTVTVFVDSEYHFVPEELYVDATTGRVGIGTTTPEYDLHVAGDVAANSFVNVSTRGAKTDIEELAGDDYTEILGKIASTSVAEYRYAYESDDDPLRLGLIAEDAPSEVLSVSGDGVDIYKLATFALAGVKAQQLRLNELELRLESLEEMIADGQAITNGGGGVLSYLQGFGVKIAKGVAEFGDLFADRIVVGNPVRPSGITLYDEATGAPYCLKISGGEPTAEPGECPDPNEVLPDPGDGSGNTGGGDGTGTTTPDGTSTDTATGTTTPDGTGTTTDDDTTTTPDSTPPVITLSGGDMILTEGDSFTDPGATALDDTDGDITDDIVVGGSVETATAGIYTLTYDVTDASGNVAATITRTVEVEEPVEV